MIGRLASRIWLAAVLLVPAAAVSAQAGLIPGDLITNGGFESPGNGLAGWTVPTGDYNGSVYVEADPTKPGNRCAHLTQNGSESYNRHLVQTISNIKPGVDYKLGFMLQGVDMESLSLSKGELAVRLEWLTATGSLLSDKTVGKSVVYDNTAWKAFWAAPGGKLADGKFTAPVGAAKLKVSFTNLAERFWEARIDNITLIPEPSTWAALASLGVVGFFAYRRRQAAA